jgi:hypothetical protein
LAVVAVAPATFGSAGHGAPICTHRVRSATTWGGSCVFGGIFVSWSSHRTAFTSGLLPGSAGQHGRAGVAALEQPLAAVEVQVPLSFSARAEWQV